MDTVQKQYDIPANNYDWLVGHIEKLSKKSVKLIGQPIELTLQREWVREKELEGGERERTLMYTVEIQGIQPKIHGWQFVATLEHTQVEGETFNIIRAVPGMVTDGELFAYREMPPLCEQCHTIRKRIDTFVLRHESGRAYKQVGRNCLAAFLGGTDPHALAAYAETLALADEAIRTCEEDNGVQHGGPHRRLFLDEYLSFVAQRIRQDGWVSRTTARESVKPATADLALTALCEYKEKIKNYTWRFTAEKPLAQDTEQAEEAVRWVRNLTAQELQSDYLYNLWVACKGVTLDVRQVGIVASLLVAHAKATEKALAQHKEQLVSAYQGTVKGKIEVAVTCVYTLQLESRYTSILHKFVDKQGNVYVWFSSSVELKQGGNYAINATVKAHEERNGVQQTVLTRCKAVEQES